MSLDLVGALTPDAVDDIPDDAEGLRSAAGRFLSAAQDVVDDASRASRTWSGLPGVLSADALTPALAPLMHPAVQQAAALQSAAEEFHRVATAAADRFTSLHREHASLVSEIEQFRASAPGQAASHIASEASSGNLLGALATAVTSWQDVPALVEQEASLRIKVTAHNIAVSETLSSVAGQIGSIGAAPKQSAFAGIVGAVAGGAAHVGSWLDGAWTGVEHFGEAAWKDVKDTAEDVWPYIEDAAATLGNFGASFLQAIRDHPDEFGAMIGGALLATVGGMAEGGGVVLDATGVGAIVGVPLNALGAAAMVAGGGMAAAGGGALAEHALTDDAETPYATDHAETTETPLTDEQHVEALDKKIDDLEQNDPTNWKIKVYKGQRFNYENYSRYDENEVTLDNGKRLDSYDPGQEIVSRKYTQLSDVQPKTAESYINELGNKYAPGEGIKGSTETLEGQQYLEVPVQKGPIPQQILDYASDREPPVIIRDVTGHEYN